MIAVAYQVTAPLVVVPDTTGAFHHFYAGTVLPDGLDEERVKQLAKDGMLEKAEQTADAGSDKPATVEEILAEVGDDKAKAQAALDEENGAAKPRKGLVGKLEAIVNG